MVTYPQLVKKARRTKQFRSSTPHFHGSPFKFGTCLKVGITKPKKPNSAQRKIAKVELSNGRKLTAYIPGFGHKLEKNSEVMVRGGRVPDLPGVHYHIMRQKKDLQLIEFPPRIHRRSKYGVKRLKESVELTRRGAAKSKKKDALKLGFAIKDSVITERIALLETYFISK